jgi:hypothetical protein
MHLANSSRGAFVLLDPLPRSNGKQEGGQLLQRTPEAHSLAENHRWPVKYSTASTSKTSPAGDQPA